jgi:hypothetical protein
LTSSPDQITSPYRETASDKFQPHSRRARLSWSGSCLRLEGHLSCS